MAHLEIAENINQHVAELMSLDKADPSFDISAGIIANKINDLFAQLMILAGISSPDSTGAGTINETIQAITDEEARLKTFSADRLMQNADTTKESGLAGQAKAAYRAIQEHVTEIISLKKAGPDARNNYDVSADAIIAADPKVIADAIGTIIADFIETNKMAIELQSIKRMTNADIFGIINQLIAEINGPMQATACFKSCARIMSNIIEEFNGKLTRLTENAFGAPYAEFVVEIVQLIAVELINIKNNGTDTETNSKLRTSTVMDIQVIALSIAFTIIAEYTFVEPIKRMTNAELVRFTHLVLLLLFISA